jgi:hypothetical protein
MKRKYDNGLCSIGILQLNGRLKELKMTCAVQIERISLNVSNQACGNAGGL